MRNFHIKHQTHFETFAKFAFLLLILVAYFFYLSFKYDFSTGTVAVALTWSFFVLCTPVADAGFLLDFPIRLLFGFRMVTIEIFVWILAITISGLVLLFSPAQYQTTLLTRVFKQIITTPYPYWSIIILCCIGTFASIYFADEMVDVIGHHERTQHHKHAFKYKILILIAITTFVSLVYYKLTKEFGLTIE